MRPAKPAFRHQSTGSAVIRSIHPAPPPIATKVLATIATLATRQWQAFAVTRPFTYPDGVRPASPTECCGGALHHRQAYRQELGRQRCGSRFRDLRAGRGDPLARPAATAAGRDARADAAGARPADR